MIALERNGGPHEQDRMGLRRLRTLLRLRDNPSCAEAGGLANDSTAATAARRNTRSRGDAITVRGRTPMICPACQLETWNGKDPHWYQGIQSRGVMCYGVVKGAPALRSRSPALPNVPQTRRGSAMPAVDPSTPSPRAAHRRRPTRLRTSAAHGNDRTSPPAQPPSTASPARPTPVARSARKRGSHAWGKRR
jgi:hypothetical protein